MIEFKITCYTIYVAHILTCMNLFVFKAAWQWDQLYLQQFKMDNHVEYDNQGPFIKLDTIPTYINILGRDNDDA